jgi:hypothetical protein
MMKEREAITWLNIDCCILDAIRDKGVIVPIRPFAIDQNTVRHPELLPVIEDLPQVLHNTTSTLENLCIQYRPRKN